MTITPLSIIIFEKLGNKFSSFYGNERFWTLSEAR
jgi:hypothetical protein